MILYDVELATTERQRDGFVRLLTRTMTSCSGEAGCLLYRFATDLTDPLRFFLSEWWEDEAALLAHARGTAFLAFLKELPEHGAIVSSVARQGNLVPYRRPAQ